jgi:hypothetical protein
MYLLGPWDAIRTIGTNGTNRYKSAERYIAQAKGDSELYQRLRSNRYRMVLIGRRLFTVEEPRRRRLTFHYAAGHEKRAHSDRTNIPARSGLSRRSGRPAA